MGKSAARAIQGRIYTQIFKYSAITPNPQNIRAENIYVFVIKSLRLLKVYIGFKIGVKNGGGGWG